MSEEKTRRRLGLGAKTLNITLAALLFVFLFIYLARGWFRITVIPAYVNVRYRHSVQGAFNDVDKELGNPISTLELNVSSVRGHNAQCSENTAMRFYIEVGCDAYIGGESRIIDEAYRQKHMEYLGSLDSKLLHGGWQKSQADSGPSSFKGLLLPPGAGYAGYVRYDKKIKGISCWISISRYDTLDGVLSCDFTSKIGREP